MRREVIFQEGGSLKDGRVVETGALILRKPTIPIVYNFNFFTNQAGLAYSLDRNPETWEVSMMLDYYPDIIPPHWSERDTWEYSIWGSILAVTGNRVHLLSLNAVAIIPKNPVSPITV